MARTVDVLNNAERIHKNEVSEQKHIEGLNSKIRKIRSRKKELKQRQENLRSEISAESDKPVRRDSEGHMIGGPDYSAISEMRESIRELEQQIDEADDQEDELERELSKAETEMREIQREKGEALVEIQRQAATASKSISAANGMYGAYAGVGKALSKSFGSALSDLSKAAQILGGSIGAGAQGGGGGLKGGAMGEAAGGAGSGSAGAGGYGTGGGGFSNALGFRSAPGKAGLSARGTPSAGAGKSGASSLAVNFTSMAPSSGNTEVVSGNDQQGVVGSGTFVTDHPESERSGLVVRAGKSGDFSRQNPTMNGFGESTGWDSIYENASHMHIEKPDSEFGPERRDIVNLESISGEYPRVSSSGGDPRWDNMGSDEDFYKMRAQRAQERAEKIGSKTLEIFNKYNSDLSNVAGNEEDQSLAGSVRSGLAESTGSTGQENFGHVHSDPGNSYQTIVSRTESLVKQCDKIEKNISLINDPMGHGLALLETSKDMKQQVNLMDQEIGRINTGIQNGLIDPQAGNAMLHDLRVNRDFLSAVARSHYERVPEELRGCSFVPSGGTGFSDVYSKLLHSQGEAYKEVFNDCGVADSVNTAGLCGIDVGGERGGLKIASDVIPIIHNRPADISNDEWKEIRKQNGMTSPGEQIQIKRKMGLDVKPYPEDISFNRIVDYIKQDHRVSLNIFGGDLMSGEKIAHRKWVLTDNGYTRKTPFNHVVTVVGYVQNSKGEPVGIFLNDTGRYGGDGNPYIYLSAKKVNSMSKYTDGGCMVITKGRSRG